MKRNGVLASALTWFGAATSIAEIEAGIRCGGQFPAVLLGHALGFALLFATGLIGARSGRSAMGTTEEAFGAAGSRLFAGLNLLQLVGWAAVMISQGATAATTLFPNVGFPAFCLAIGALAALCLAARLCGKPGVAFAAVALLAVLAVALSWRIAHLPHPSSLIPHPSALLPRPAVPFVTAFEISVALPLSWLPLVSDYTRDAERPLAVSFAAALAYSLTGIWMYVLGMAIASVDSDMSLAQVILRTGVGGAGLAVVVVSAAVSAYMDAFSSGESARTICRALPPKTVGLATCALGVLLAVLGIMDRYVGFLGLIASVFAPMAAVLLVSHYVVRRRRTVLNAVAWLAGAVAWPLAESSPLGPTLTALLVSALIALLGKHER